MGLAIQPIAICLAFRTESSASCASLRCWKVRITPLPETTRMSVPLGRDCRSDFARSLQEPYGSVRFGLVRHEPSHDRCGEQCAKIANKAARALAPHGV